MDKRVSLSKTAAGLFLLGDNLGSFEPFVPPGREIVELEHRPEFLRSELFRLIEVTRASLLLFTDCFNSIFLAFVDAVSFKYNEEPDCFRPGDSFRLRLLFEAEVFLAHIPRLF